MFILLLQLIVVSNYAQLGATGPNDTIKVQVYKVGVDSFAFYYMPQVSVFGVMTPNARAAIKERSQLRKYVIKVYPLAMKAADLINEIRRETAAMDTRKEKRQYRKAQEKRVKEEFTDQIKNMLIDEGKVLTKLIYRETGESCYDVIKEMKSGLNARFWQTVLIFFNGNLKANYDPTGADADMEVIVKEVARWYGRS